MELTLNKLMEKGFKCDIENSFFGQTGMGYLGIWVKHGGGKSIDRNIEIITNVKSSNSRKLI